ncbi:MAG: D-erythronate dehydrogenase [Rhodospirillaceae bacterium]
MKVLITGGCGFLGQMIAKAIIGKGTMACSGAGPGGGQQKVDAITLFDHMVPDAPLPWADDRVSVVSGDISDQDTVTALVDREDISIFHLASVVSAGGEKDFDLAIQVNLMGGLNVLEAARATGTAPRVVFASSLAAFGGPDLPRNVDDLTRHTPQTTYGMTKAFGELAINDYTRKGYIDGRTVRLPTIVIRPGAPNAAASGWASGIFREPLQGREHLLPVSEDFQMMLLGYRNAVRGFIAAHEAKGADIGPDRSVALPNNVYTVKEMIAALERVAGEDGIRLGPINPRPDPSVAAICGSWPLFMDPTRAFAIGCPADETLDQVIRDFREDFLK